MPKIFGREPVLWLALVAVLVKFIAAFWVHVSADQQAVINVAAAAVMGLMVALIVGDGISAAVLGLIQAVLAVFVGFGFHLDADHQALVMSVATAIVAMFTRTQVTAPVGPKPLVRVVPRT